ncbi:MAG: hypothetical protein K0Q81_2229, partial [Paenibacillus sp.]|nr:hypothetical protein [Paenibacillus sp.]
EIHNKGGIFNFVKFEQADGDSAICFSLFVGHNSQSEPFYESAGSIMIMVPL